MLEVATLSKLTSSNVWRFHFKEAGRRSWQRQAGLFHLLTCDGNVMLQLFRESTQPLLIPV